MAPCTHGPARLSSASIGASYCRPHGSRQAGKLALVDDRGRPVVPHGFRATFRVWAMEVPQAPFEVCEAALAHVQNDQTVAAYARSDLFKARRELMQRWADFEAAERAGVGAAGVGADTCSSSSSTPCTGTGNVICTVEASPTARSRTCWPARSREGDVTSGAPPSRPQLALQAQDLGLEGGEEPSRTRCAALARDRPQGRRAQRVERREPVEQVVSLAPPHAPSASHRSTARSRRASAPHARSAAGPGARGPSPAGIGTAASRSATFATGCQGWLVRDRLRPRRMLDDGYELLL